METLLADLRSGLRLLRRAPAFSAIALLTLALGIGANTAIFSSVYNAILRALPYEDADRLVMVWEDASYISFPRNTPAPANYFDWKRQNRVFTDMAATRGSSVNLTTDGPPEQALGRAVTANFFSVLGVHPLLGRTFTEEEDQSRATLVVINYGLWQRRYGGDPGVIGKSIMMNGAPRTIVGVMPREFIFRTRDLDYWVPMNFSPQDIAQRNSHFLNVVARLTPGVTVAAANADMDRVAKQLAVDYPASNARVGAVVISLREDLLGDVEVELWVLMAAAGCVLLIACANLASLLLVRAANRRGELAVRASLGATEQRLVRQLVGEGVVLAVFGGGLGLALAPLAMRVIARLVPTSIPAAGSPVLSVPTLLFTLALSVGTGLIFSAMPALEAARASLAAGLRHAGRSAVGRRRRFGNVMVVVQVAVAIALLASTGLLLRTLTNLRAIDLGFRADNVLTLRTTLPRQKYDTTHRSAFYDRVLAEVRALPGVIGAAYASTLPFQSIGNTNGYRFEAGAGTGEPTDALFRVGTHEYLQTLDATLVSGRLLDPRDVKDAPGAVVVNETLARRHWPSESPLGHRLNFGRPDSNVPWFTIVGVVKDVRERGYEREMKPGVYLPYHQTLDTWAVPETLVVRTKGSPLGLASAIRAIVANVDPEQPVSAVRTLDEIVDLDIADRTEQLTLLAAFAGLALLLASLGLYSLLAYNVTERRHEIGLRMALGARARAVVGAVVTRSLWLTLTGIGVGLLLSVATTRSMRSLLYGVDAFDPTTLAAAAGLFIVVAVAASVVPSMRAARVDPMVALREE